MRKAKSPQQGAVLVWFLTAYLHGEEQASPAFEYWVLSACCTIVLAFKFSGLFWSAVEGQTWVRALLLLTWLHVAQTMDRVCVLLLTEEGIRSAHLVASNPLFGSLWLGPLIEKMKNRQLVYMKLFYAWMAALVCCKSRWHPSLSLSISTPIL